MYEYCPKCKSIMTKRTTGDYTCLWCPDEKMQTPSPKPMCKICGSNIGTIVTDDEDPHCTNCNSDGTRKYQPLNEDDFGF